MAGKRRSLACVWQIADNRVEGVVSAALEMGYRSVDTAAIYDNESGVGRGLPMPVLHATNCLLPPNYGTPTTGTSCPAGLSGQSGSPDWIMSTFI